MWLGKQSAERMAQSQPDVGLVTISGDEAGVYTNLERRKVTSYAPGGYFWLPQEGENMLFVRTMHGEDCIAGAEQTARPPQLQPGEVMVRSKDDAAHLWLRNNGTIEIKGNVSVAGSVSVSGSISATGTVSGAEGVYGGGNLLD